MFLGFVAIFFVTSCIGHVYILLVIYLRLLRVLPPLVTLAPLAAL